MCFTTGWYSLVWATCGNLLTPGTLICLAQRRWLDDDEMRNENLTSPEYDNLRLRVWQKTGCLITADRSEDQLIKPGGLKNYVVPQPAYLPPSACLPQIEENPVSGAEDMVSEEEPDPEDPCEELPDTDMAEIQAEIQEDRFEDRNYNHGLVGRKVTALYENGWFTGTIVHFNKQLKEYKVDYADETSNYLSLHDFDGVKVILEPDCKQ